MKDKIIIAIRIISVISLLGLIIFMFATSKGSVTSRSYAKILEVKENSVIVEMGYREFEIVIDETNGLELIEGQWYKTSHKVVSWGYHPLSFTLESTFSLLEYHEIE